MKKCFIRIFGLLIFSVVFITAACAQHILKEGKWSMTMVTHMDNMPPEMAAAMQQMQNMPPEVKAQMQQMQAKMGVQMNADGQGMTVTVTRCLTQKNPVPDYIKDKKMQDYCQQTHEIDGNTVNFHMTCDHDDMQMDSTGSMTYSGDSMQGQIKTHQTRAGKTMDSTIDMTGQYLGPC